MPIVIQQQSPFSPQTAAGQGALDQDMKDREFYQQQAAQQAQLQLQAQQQAQNAYQFEAQRLPSMRDDWLAQQEDQQRKNQQQFQMDYQQKAFQLQSELHKTQLSQAESLRMQRVERQLNYVQENGPEGTGRFSQGEVDDMTTELNTGISPLQRRMQQAQQIQVELRNTQMQEDARMHAIGNRTYTDLMNGPAYNRQTGMLSLTDPTDPTRQRHYLPDASGRLTPVDFGEARNLQNEVLERNLYGGATRSDVENDVRDRLRSQIGVIPDNTTVEQAIGQQNFQREVQRELTRRATPRGSQLTAEARARLERQYTNDLNEELATWNNGQAPAPRQGQPQQAARPMPTWLHEYINTLSPLERIAVRGTGLAEDGAGPTPEIIANARRWQVARMLQTNVRDAQLANPDQNPMTPAPAPAPGGAGSQQGTQQPQQQALPPGAPEVPPEVGLSPSSIPVERVNQLYDIARTRYNSTNRFERLGGHVRVLGQLVDLLAKASSEDRPLTIAERAWYEMYQRGIEERNPDLGRRLRLLPR